MVTLAALLAVVVLLGGIGGGAVGHTPTPGPGVALAQTEPANQPPTATLLARMAKTLGIDEPALNNAIAQAQRELEVEALTERLQRMVEAGKITLEQADQYLNWYKSRPAIPFRGLPGIKGGPGHLAQPLLARVAKILGIEEQALKDAFIKAQQEMQIEALTQRLQKMVEAGRITQEQADQYLNWFKARPDVGPAFGLGFGPHRFGGPMKWRGWR